MMNVTFLKKYLVILALVLFSANILAQGYTPMRGGAIEAKAVNDNGFCFGCYNGSLDPLIDSNLNNYVSMGSFVTLSGGNGISVKDKNHNYPAGTITGFNIDLGGGLITASLLSSLRISTYKDGVLQESTTSTSLLSVPAFAGNKSRIFLHFRTNKSFNEVRLYQKNAISIFTAMNVYYAFAFDPKKMPEDNNNICDDIISGSGVDNNVSGSSSFIAPLSYVFNKQNISDGDKNSFGTIMLPLGVAGSYSVGLLDTNQTYPAGNRAGFVISPDDEGKLLSAEFLKNITIETYLYGQLQDSENLLNGGGIINIKVLGFGTGKQKVSLNTTKPFNEIRLKVTQTLGVNLGALKVYYAFEEPVGCDCDDKIQTSVSAIAGNLQTGINWTSGQGLFGILFSKMINPEAIVDANKENYATATIPAASFLSLFSAYATVNTNSIQPANTFAGFTIDKAANLAGVSFLELVTVTLYRDNVQTDVFTGSGSLISGNLITSNSNKFYVGGKSTKPFNRMKITFYSGSGIRFPQTYNIYNAFASKDDDNDGVPNCYDLCPNGNDSIDNNGNGIPDCAEGCSALNDKSQALDTDGDGVPDACDMDSDNDGIPDALEDVNKNGFYEDDDNEGDQNFISVLGDSVPNYRDLDSDNDGILDLFEAGIPMSVLNTIDKDKNGIIDSDISVGTNGIADILETSPDSGVMKYKLKDTDGDGVPDYMDLKSNSFDFDLHKIGKENLDPLFGGFINLIKDNDKDGIMDQIDTDIVNRGAPGSPLSPYSLQGRVGFSNVEPEVIKDDKIYPNPVKSGDVLNIETKNPEGKTTYYIYSAQGQLVKSDSFVGKIQVSTASLVAGFYIVKLQTGESVKSYKIIVK
ncbi:T9SS type A sorting domain-containing protein [Chryseobacterium oryzae]|uniref:T9SS type A sorting domain-containing protein n=1 Tax=Chryseobacterium oryzae TaxID=2929799 RepID=A0ABY4BJ86_9FLAO|nr:T9SS type A sorting domain-containing protein [Chryseobacterium oryzae]UOE37771.1 T9SS type A sorting domain-containing protein [Chryseobacterium oryzae]